MKHVKNHGRQLHSVAQFSLFVTSYSPLFVLLIARQLFENSEFLNWGGFNFEAVQVFIKNFFLSAILSAVCLFGFIGFKFTIYNLSNLSVNGFNVTLKDIKNKNSEAIGYVATYIIPFLFQSFSGWYETFSILFLLYIIFRIYINSTLILVNPVLNMWYCLYEIEFDENGILKTGMMISNNKYLEEGEDIKIYPVGHKLFFSNTLN